MEVPRELRYQNGVVAASQQPREPELPGPTSLPADPRHAAVEPQHHHLLGISIQRREMPRVRPDHGAPERKAQFGPGARDLDRDEGECVTRPSKDRGSTGRESMENSGVPCSPPQET